jgi:dTMP kinase
MNIDCPEIMRPDVCIFLDVSPEVGLSRVQNGSRGFTEIYEKADTLRAVRKKYFDAFELLKTTDNVKIISADRSADEIASDVLAAVKEL